MGTVTSQSVPASAARPCVPCPHRKHWPGLGPRGGGQWRPTCSRDVECPNRPTPHPLPPGAALRSCHDPASFRSPAGSPGAPGRPCSPVWQAGSLSGATPVTCHLLSVSPVQGGGSGFRPLLGQDPTLPSWVQSGWSRRPQPTAGSPWTHCPLGHRASATPPPSFHRTIQTAQESKPKKQNGPRTKGNEPGVRGRASASWNRAPRPEHVG